jgi:ketosteroid isomerase-like protein
MSQENVEIVREGIEAWNAGDMERLRERYDPDAIAQSPPDWPEPGPFVGRDAIMQAFRQVRDAFDSDAIELLSDFLTVGDRVPFHAEAEARTRSGRLLAYSRSPAASRASACASTRSSALGSSLRRRGLAASATWTRATSPSVSCDIAYSRSPAASRASALSVNPCPCANSPSRIVQTCQIVQLVSAPLRLPRPRSVSVATT